MTAPPARTAPSEPATTTITRIYLRGERCGQVETHAYPARFISAAEFEQAWLDAVWRRYQSGVWRNEETSKQQAGEESV